MTRFQRIALLAGGITAALLAAVGLAAAAEDEPAPGPAPGPKPKRPAITPAPVAPQPGEPPPTSPITPPDTVPGPSNGGGTTPGLPTPIFTPNVPILPDPVEPEVPGFGPDMAAWVVRHGLLKEAGYWPFSAGKPVSGDTVEAIQTFQAQTEAARNQLQGANMAADELSQQYGVIVPDGKWGPVTAEWVKWAIANKGLHSQAVFAQTGQPAGWAG